MDERSPAAHPRRRDEGRQRASLHVCEACGERSPPSRVHEASVKDVRLGRCNPFGFDRLNVRETNPSAEIAGRRKWSSERRTIRGHLGPAAFQNPVGKPWHTRHQAGEGESDPLTVEPSEKRAGGLSLSRSVGPELAALALLCAHREVTIAPHV
jgi:hypothetical protein